MYSFQTKNFKKSRKGRLLWSVSWEKLGTPNHVSVVTVISMGIYNRVAFIGKPIKYRKPEKNIIMTPFCSYALKY